MNAGSPQKKPPVGWFIAGSFHFSFSSSCSRSKMSRVRKETAGFSLQLEAEAPFDLSQAHPVYLGHPVPGVPGVRCLPVGLSGVSSFPTGIFFPAALFAKGSENGQPSFVHSLNQGRGVNFFF